MLDQAQKLEHEQQLLATIAARLPELETMLERANGKWIAEDASIDFIIRA
ncbi:MAG TPA: hypothetical protein VFE62_04950 [Gemmataceae bacterium]|nr:hypothetical protein [Gemmataceae bacterium]